MPKMWEIGLVWNHLNSLKNRDALYCLFLIFSYTTGSYLQHPVHLWFPQIKPSP